MALRPLFPVFLTYVLSFIFLGIYWNNHHHLLHATEKINGKILWANLHLLFWLSLVPFATGWMGENHVAPLPTALYGSVLLFAAVAYTILQKLIIANQGRESKLGVAIGNEKKEWLSLAGYILGISLSFVNNWVAVGCYIAVALTWLIPDRRIEAKLNDPGR